MKSEPICSLLSRAKYLDTIELCMNATLDILSIMKCVSKLQYLRVLLLNLHDEKSLPREKEEIIASTVSKLEFPYLKKLNLQWCNGSLISSLQCPRLTQLVFRGTLCIIPDAGIVIRAFPLLEELYFVEKCIVESCMPTVAASSSAIPYLTLDCVISDKTVISIVSMCPMITDFVLCSPDCTDTIISELHARNLLQRCTYLGYECFPNATDTLVQTIAYFVDANPQMKRLYFWNFGDTYRNMRQQILDKSNVRIGFDDTSS